MPLRIDPARFTDKSFTRRPIGQNNYALLVDGLVAGRITLTTFADNFPEWMWTITGPFFPPDLDPSHGAADTLEEAQEAFKAKFWQWHGWAMEQTGAAAWRIL